MNETGLVATGVSAPWRITASRVVEELFRVTPETAWDELLDLRGLLVRGQDWAAVLESFMICRRRLEEDHYLPFFRLRRILSAHLKLENVEDGESLERLLRARDFNFRKWQKRSEKRGVPARVLEGTH